MWGFGLIGFGLGLLLSNCFGSEFLRNFVGVGIVLAGVLFLQKK